MTRDEIIKTISDSLAEPVAELISEVEKLVRENEVKPLVNSLKRTNSFLETLLHWDMFADSPLYKVCLDHANKNDEILKGHK